MARSLSQASSKKSLRPVRKHKTQRIGQDKSKSKAEAALRLSIIQTCLDMNKLGLNQGASGNIGARISSERFLITPSGLPYDRMKPVDLPIVSLDGHWWGKLRPSTEWRLHRDIFAARPEIEVVLHSHSRHTTAIACLGEEIPAFHYMIAAAGGADIRCAPYATFGSQALSDGALHALEGRKACLLANHGLIIAERSLEKALSLAVEIEHLAATWIAARQIGKPRILGTSEMARVLHLFQTYGTADFPDSELQQAGIQAPRR